MTTRKAAPTRRARSGGPTATIAFACVDAYGQPLADRMDVVVRSVPRNRALLERKDVDARKPVTVGGLEPSEVCAVQVFPVRHRPVGRFLKPAPGTVQIACPVDPGRVARMVAPDFGALPARAQHLLESTRLEHAPLNVGGQALYDALDAIPRAGLLNLLAKMAATALLDGSTVLDHVQSFYRLRGDRVFANVGKGLRDLVKTAVDARRFHLVDGALHQPPDRFRVVDSYKTIPDRYGNLQVTFFASVATPLTFKADIDVDDAQGIGHVFQVLGHWLTGQPTHPYDIHQILVAYQGIDPGYRLET